MPRHEVSGASENGAGGGATGGQKGEATIAEPAREITCRFISPGGTGTPGILGMGRNRARTHGRLFGERNGCVD